MFVPSVAKMLLKENPLVYGDAPDVTRPWQEELGRQQLTWPLLPSKL